MEEQVAWEAHTHAHSHAFAHIYTRIRVQWKRSPIDSLNAVITKVIVKKINRAITFFHCGERGLQNVGLKRW